MGMKFDFFVDWLEFTYLVPDGLNGLSPWQNFLADFPEFADRMIDFVPREKGLFGYTDVLQYYDEMMIGYNHDHPEFGVHVIFNGSGIYRICEFFGVDNLQEHIGAKKIFEILKKRSCRITRIDIAYDDYTKTFKPSDFGLWKMQKRISTKCQRYEIIGSEDSRGDTFCLGRRGDSGNGRYLRIYDKEYESKGKIDAIRYEFEMRRAWAQKITDLVLNDQHFSFADLLEDMFDIVNEYDLSGDKNIDKNRKSRAGQDEKWALFLETIRKIYDSDVDLKIDNKKKDNSFEKKREWLILQVMPSLFMFVAVYGLKHLEDIIDMQHGKLTDMQRKMLDKYLYEMKEDINF